MSDAQERFSYHAARAVDLWILEKTAEEQGNSELAAEIKATSQYDVTKAEQARQDLETEARNNELNRDCRGKDCFGQ